MNLERLPNEILLELFKYFNGTDLIDAFYDLNSRFNILLYNEVRFYRFKFYTISKRKFDMICQQHLPFVADRVISLHLYDAQNTPEQINSFFSHIPSLRQFPRLRSLSIIDIHSHKTLLKFVEECEYLCNLTHLNFYFYPLPIDNSIVQLIVDNIWSLPKLTYCDVKICTETSTLFCLPTKTSATLECVKVQGCNFQWNQLNRLYEYTPRLKRLSINIKSTIHDHYIPCHLSTLIYLKIHYDGTTSEMISLLQNTPNLCHLNVELSFDLINGHQWEEIIRNYLPNLRVFRLKMERIVGNDQNVQEKVDDLIDTFRSPFWIDEHKWFVRCFPSQELIHLHTLSAQFDYDDEMCSNLWRSTYPYDNQENFHRNIINIYDDDFFEQSFPSGICLPNIVNIFIGFPINKQFWTIVPNLNRLDFLSISSYEDNFQSQLQIILNHAPHLRNLEISQDKSLPLQRSLFKHTTTFVHHLNSKYSGHYFNVEECITLSHSSLGVQCEVLSVQVKNRQSIIILVQNMINLQALLVKYEPSAKRDKVIEWLKDRLPSTCLISKDTDSVGCIQLWI
jgi:hypothetical protein